VRSAEVGTPQPHGVQIGRSWVPDCGPLRHNVDVPQSAREPARVWVAPEVWPPAPDGFVPPAGWQPDPAWPPAPVGHKFWTLTARGRRRRVWLVTGMVAALAWFAVCSAVVGPRVAPAFSTLNTIIAQLPPGDTFGATITNNTSHTVDAFACDGDDCTRGWDPAVLGPRQSSGWNEDQFAPVQLGVANPTTHVLLGCFTLPHATSADDEVPDTTVKASALKTCPGVGRVVSFFDPFA
jgi:hypothetical protein